MSLQTIVKACAFAVAITLGAGSAQAQTVTLKLSHFVPPQHVFHKWITAWAEKIEKESNGRLKFEIDPNGQLVGPPNRQFDAARNGIVDIAWCLHGVTPGRYPMTELANLPFTFPSVGVNLPEMAKRLTELAPKYLAAEHTGLHILHLLHHLAEILHGLSSTSKLASPASGSRTLSISAPGKRLSTA